MSLTFYAFRMNSNELYKNNLSGIVEIDWQGTKHSIDRLLTTLVIPQQFGVNTDSEYILRDS